MLIRLNILKKSALIICVLHLCEPADLFTQAAYFPTGAGVAGMAGASVTRGDTWATFNNPAMLAKLENLSAGVNYENRFLVRKLGISSLAAAMPVGTGAFGLTLNQFGSNLYSQTFAGLAYGRNFGGRFRAGVRLDALHTQLAEDYGRRTDLSFALGFGANLTDDLVLAAALFNPARISSARDFDESLPAVYRAGLAYRIETNLIVTVEAEKDVRYKPTFRTGIEYRFKDIGALRAGIGTNPVTHSFGFGFNFSDFVFDIAAVRHEVLGFSPQASLIWIKK
jgi:hypothetical protein